MIRRLWHAHVLHHTTRRHHGYWFCLDCMKYWENGRSPAYRD